MTSHTTPPSYDRARPQLLGFSLYAIVFATLLLFAPEVLLESPLLRPIEKVTGLPHLAPPTTLLEKQYVAFLGAFGTTMATLYTLQAGPAWQTTGRHFAEASITMRLGFAFAAWGICLFTPYGNSFVFLGGTMDALTALLTKYTLGVGFGQLLTGRRPSEKRE